MNFWKKPPVKQNAVAGHGRRSVQPSLLPPGRLLVPIRDRIRSAAAQAEKGFGLNSTSTVLSELAKHACNSTANSWFRRLADQRFDLVWLCESRAWVPEFRYGRLLLRRDLHDLHFKELGAVFPIRDVLQPLEFSFCFLRCRICVFYPTYYDRALKALERHSLRVDEIIKKNHAKFSHDIFVPLFRSESAVCETDLYQAT
jgi:hypothetical protein